MPEKGAPAGIPAWFSHGVHLSPGETVSGSPALFAPFDLLVCAASQHPLTSRRVDAARGVSLRASADFFLGTHGLIDEFPLTFPSKAQ